MSLMDKAAMASNPELVDKLTRGGQRRGSQVIKVPPKDVDGPPKRKADESDKTEAEAKPKKAKVDPPKAKAAAKKEPTAAAKKPAVGQNATSGSGHTPKGNSRYNLSDIFTSIENDSDFKPGSESSVDEDNEELSDDDFNLLKENLGDDAAMLDKRKEKKKSKRFKKAIASSDSSDDNDDDDADDAKGKAAPKKAAHFRLSAGSA